AFGLMARTLMTCAAKRRRCVHGCQSPAVGACILVSQWQLALGHGAPFGWRSAQAWLQNCWSSRLTAFPETSQVQPGQAHLDSAMVLILLLNAWVRAGVYQ